MTIIFIVIVSIIININININIPDYSNRWQELRSVCRRQVVVVIVGLLN